MNTLDTASPRVSFVMGAYNCAPTLDAALQSIVDQTYTNWDLVVCDDASTDGTYEKLLAWQARYPDQMTVLRNAENSKLSFTLNRCLEVASGDLIARMDGDDLSVPERLEAQVAFLDDHPEVDLVGTAMRRFSEAGDADVVCPPAEPDRWSLRYGVPFCHATILARPHVFARTGGYSVLPRAERNEDLDLWFRFYSVGLTGRNLQEPLYRVREDISAIRRRTWRNRLNVFRTTVHGFRLLRYPWHWYLRPVLALGKALVPARAAVGFRSFQRLRAERRDTA